ncbi:MAG: FAD-dependent oxidoreductase [Thermodesulfobacteriota bacterium]
MSAPEEKRRWWGWGLEEVEPPSAQGFLSFLQRHVSPWPDWTLPVPELESLDPRPPSLPAALESELAAIVGRDNLRQDMRSRVLHSCGRGYRDLIRMRLGLVASPPDVVIYPTEHLQVGRILAAAAGHHAAVVPFGGGSSVVGGLELPPELRPAVCLDLRRMNRVLSLDRTGNTARVQAGIYGPDLEEALNREGFTLGHFPQSFEFSTLGGWIATRGAGHKSTRYGKIENMVLSLQAVLPQGEIRTPRSPAQAAGADLTGLLIGSEGILGVITEAEVRIRPRPEREWFGAWLFPDFDSGREAVRTMLSLGLAPATIRLSDGLETAALMAEAAGRPQGWWSRLVREKIAPLYLRRRGVTPGRASLLLIMGEGRSDEVRMEKRHVGRVCRENGGVAAGSGPARAWHETRYAAPYLRDELITRGLLVETIETAATWDRLPELYQAVNQALAESLNRGGRKSIVMTHLSHSYLDGANLYFTFLAPQERGREEEQWREAKTAATKVIVEQGGALSHHHGVGRDHKPWLDLYWGRELSGVLRAAKNRLDPLALLNPGVLIEPEVILEPGEKYRPFSPATRMAAWRRFQSEVFDLLVVGGGIVGAGVAWDASLRGLSVALVEKGDFASGTSGKSSRMIHGGLRYLKMLDLKLVRESLAERHHLLSMAPHLVKPMKHLVPVYKGEGDSRRLLQLGLWGYDALAGSKGLPHHENLTAEEILALEPSISSEGLTGGFIYYDALTDDARLTLETIKAAARAGATAANYVEAVNLDPSAELMLTRLRDIFTGQEVAVQSKCVVNAAGAWSDRVRVLADAEAQTNIKPAKGIHITFPRALKPISHVVILKGSDGRALFAVPAGQMVYVGTTDREYQGDLDSVAAEVDEVDYLIEAVNNVLAGEPLTRDKVTATWAGIRPLVAPSGKKEETKDISREHEIRIDSGRLISVYGGKLTTFRVMAAQAVERVLTLLGSETRSPAPTADLPLCGPPVLEKEVSGGFPPAVTARLKDKYGPQAETILGLARSPRLAAVLDEGLGLLAAEVTWSVQGEMAMTLVDAMVRRLGLVGLTPDNGLAAAPRVAGQMAGLLTWSEEETQRQLKAYHEYLDRTLTFQSSSR